MMFSLDTASLTEQSGMFRRTTRTSNYLLLNDDSDESIRSSSPPSEHVTRPMDLDSAGEGSVDSPTDHSILSPGEVDGLDDDEALVDYLLREGLAPTDVPVCRATLPSIVEYLKNGRSSDVDVTGLASSPLSLESQATSRLRSSTEEPYHNACEHVTNSALSILQADGQVLRVRSQGLLNKNEPSLHRSPTSVADVVEVSTSLREETCLDDCTRALVSDDTGVRVSDNDPLLNASWCSLTSTSKSVPVPTLDVVIGSSGNVITLDDPRTYSCKHGGCGRVYDKRSGLAAHVRRHTGDRPFRCSSPGCTWRFSRSDELVRHERSHSGVRPYPCRLCDKRFARSDHLAKHQNVHRKRRSLPVQLICR